MNKAPKKSKMTKATERVAEFAGYYTALGMRVTGGNRGNHPAGTKALANVHSVMSLVNSFENAAVSENFSTGRAELVVWDKAHPEQTVKLTAI